MEKSIKNILVIRLSAMGDCAMAVPVLLRFKKQYPKVNITVLTKPFFTSIFKTLPYVEVLTANTKEEHKGLIGILKLGAQLKEEEFDAIADLHNVLRSKMLRLFFMGTKTAKINKGRAEKRALTRTANKTLKPLKTTPERYSAVFDRLGFPLDLKAEVELPRPELPEDGKPFFAGTFKKIIGIAPFAAHSPKEYPLDLMEEVITDLTEKNLYKILLFGGGKQEVSRLKRLEKKFKNVVSVAGELPFERELGLIGNLDLMISMDSGNGHLAAMYGIPVITLWGGTHPYAGFAPFGQPIENQILPDLHKYPLLPTSIFGNKQRPGYEEVMRSITPKRVVNRVLQVLES